MNRRSFLKTSAATGAGLLILPSGSLFGANRPGNKLNIALLGTWGRARAHIPTLQEENIVALCDVDSKYLAAASKKFPKAKTYSDWRKCLEQKDLDAVVCCTPDHHHAFISLWAMHRGLHVYMEKPLGNSVEEVRLVREAYLAKKDKLCTQCGTQRHANPNFARVRELIRDGAVGELKQVYAWGNRKIPRDGYLPDVGGAPAHLDWDLWLGPSPFHPYNPGYFPKDGGNCTNWNMFWDFGNGQIGDMGSHTIDLAWNPLDGSLPTHVEAVGDPFNKDVSPVGLTIHADHPANSWRPAIRVSWYQGGHMPKSPKPSLDLEKIGHGAMFKGDRGILLCDFDSRMLLPIGEAADMTYYRPRSKSQVAPSIGNFVQEWTRGCKGSLKTSCDFEYSGNALEQLVVGLAAYRAGKKLDYDPAAGRCTNAPEVNALFRKEYRKGWTLKG